MANVFMRARRKGTEIPEKASGDEHEDWSGEMQLEAKELPEPWRAGRDEEGFFPRAWGGGAALATPLIGEF